MKRSLQIMGLLVVLALLVGLIPTATAAPVAANISPLKWDTIAAAAATNPSENSNFAVGPDGNTVYLVDTSRVAPLTRNLTKSTSQGTSFATDLTPYLGLAAGDVVMQVACAPDDANIIAVVIATAATFGFRQVVRLSADGGTTWANTSFPTAVGIPPAPLIVANEEIADIAISAGYPMAGGTARDVAVVTRDPTGVWNGEVLFLQLKPLGVGGWVRQDVAIAGNPAVPRQTFTSIMFAPAYAGDYTFVVIGATNIGAPFGTGILVAGVEVLTAAAVAGTYCNIANRDIVKNQSAWNSYTNWPVEVKTATTIASANATTLITSALALPADFSGQVDRMRRIYVSWDDDGATFGAAQDVFRLDNTRVYTLGLGLRPYSIAYSGSFNAGKLLATVVSTSAAIDATVGVWRSLNPMSSTPSWDQPFKAPTGTVLNVAGVNETRSQVAWTPDGKNALLGSFTTLAMNAITTPAAWAGPALSWQVGLANDESAFQRSQDDSDTWNQISRCDTTITGISDLQVAANLSQMYMGTYNVVTNYNSIWRSAAVSTGGGWQRVRLALMTAVALPYTSPLIRLAGDKEDGSVVFWADTSGTMLQRSVDSGRAWSNTLPNFNVADFTAPDQNTLFILGWAPYNGKVRKGTSTGPGWLWDVEVPTNITNGHTIVSQGNTILVGSAAAGAIGSLPNGIAGNGMQGYSLDGGKTWTRILYTPAMAGNQHVAIDKDFATNKTVYLSTDNALGSVYRFVIGTSTGWEDMTTYPRTIAVPAAGIYRATAVSTAGVVYAVDGVAGAGSLRTIEGTNAMPKPGVDWVRLLAQLPGTRTFVNEPSGAMVAGASPNVTIFAIDSAPAADVIAVFRDTLTIDKPVISAPKDGATIAMAPATGFAIPFGIHWSVVSLSNSYWVDFATGPDFADQVPGWPLVIAPANNMDPSQVVPNNTLLAGQTYYIRTRVMFADTLIGAANQMIPSPYSPVVKITVQPGVPVVAPSIGLQALGPPNGANTVPIQGVGFSWTSFQGATEYSFVLATDAALTKTVVKTTTTTAAYAYDGKLTNSTTYFWQVQQTKPVASDISPVFTFTTAAVPPPVVTPPAQPTPTVIVNIPPQPVQGTPVWVWIVIGIGALMVIVTIVLIFRTRR